MKPQMDFRF